MADCGGRVRNTLRVDLPPWRFSTGSAGARQSAASCNADITMPEQFPMTGSAGFATAASDDGGHRRVLRRSLGAALVAAVLVLAGCGGGGDAGVTASTGIDIGVSVAGANYARASSGQLLDVVAAVGQTVEFDANEPVTWSFSVNGSPLFINGTTVDVGGVTITQVQVDPSRIVLESTFYGPALLPIEVVLVATSSIDNAQVTTIRLSLQ